ncbi:MAG: hypothetical protein QXT45_03115 [Candidatus Bilamarchaeaceae archaeon]
MKLEYSQKIGKEAEDGNADSELTGKSEERKSRLREFCSKLWDATKRNAATICFAAGAALAVHGCGGGSITTHEDGDTTEVYEENENEAKLTDDGEEAPESIDGDEAKDETEVGGCPGQSTPLEGDVNPVFVKTRTETIILASSDSWVTGQVELKNSSEFSGGLTILGECPNDPESIIAFGAKNSIVNVTPQYRIDLNNTTAQLPRVDGELCEPLIIDNVPVSILNDETKAIVKNVSVGVESTVGFFEIVGGISPLIMLDGSETNSQILIDSEGYATKLINTVLPPSQFALSIRVNSKTGQERITRTVEGRTNERVISKTLRVYTLGPEDSLMPQIEWIIPFPPFPHNMDKVVSCLRSCTNRNEIMEKTIEINATITPRADDSCGKIFDGVSISSTTLTLSPRCGPPYCGTYSSELDVVEGQLAPMTEGNLKLALTIRRTPPTSSLPLCPDEDITVEIRGVLTSQNLDPRTGLVENRPFTISFEITVPDQIIYGTFCDCMLPPECE